MSSALPTNARLGVPEGILAPLQRVAARQRMTRAWQGLLQCAVATLAVFLLAVLLLGSFPEWPVAVRVSLAGAAYGAILWSGVYALRHAFGKTTLSVAAQRAEQALPELQERLSSAVELTQESDERFRGSPALVACLIRQAEQQAGKIEPEVVVSGRGVLHWFVYLLPVILLWLILAIVMPEVLSRGFAGALKPWTAAPVPGIALKIDPGSREIAAGDPLEINVSIVDPEGLTRRHPVEHVAVLTRHATGQSVANDMDLVDAGKQAYRKVIDSTQQDFDYRIATELVQSEFYHVHVLRRPAVEGLEIRYDYPPYTRLKSKTVTSKDGAIEAMVGTKVSLTVHANQRLASESRLYIAPAGAGAATGPGVGGELTLTPIKGNDYGAAFTVERSTQYCLRLTGETKYHAGEGDMPLTNKDDQYRPIVARPDLPPTITIVDPQDKLVVRPSDHVKVKWEAGDDFGVARVQAIVMVNESATEVVDVPMVAADPTKANGQWVIDVPEQIARRGLTRAHEISYQLEATDNCEPVAHTALSAKQVLWIDAAVDSLETREDKAAARELQAALQRVREKIAAAQKTVETLARANKNMMLTAEQRQLAENTKRDMENLQKTVDTLAQQQQDGKFKGVAGKLKELADKPVKNAAEDMAKTQLSADEPTARDKPISDAARQLAQARQALDELEQQFEQLKHDTNLADAVRDLAQRQKELTEAMQHASSEKAAKPAQLAQEQRNLQKKLEDVIRQNPALEKPVVQAAQAKVDDLLKRLEDIQKQQQELAQRTAAQTTAQQKIDDLVQQQEKLNGDIKKFAHDQSRPLQKAQAGAPRQQKLDATEQDLKNKQFDKAVEQQQQAAKTLDEAASHLERGEKEVGAEAKNAEARLPQDKQDQAQAQDLQKQTDQLADQIKQSTEQNQAPTRPGDPANQQANKIADDVKKAADALAQHHAETKGAAADARKHADQARQEAADGQANAAQQDLATAARTLANAAQQQSDQAQEAIDKDKAPENQAARQAHELAERQRQVAKATQDAAGNQTDPARAAETPAEQQKVAETTDKAAKAAGDLQKQAQNVAPQLAQRTGAAASEISKAAQAQRDAASLGQKNDVPGASQAQQNATKSIARAEEALRGSDQAATTAGNEKSSGAGPSGGEKASQGAGATPNGSAAMDRAAKDIQSAETAAGEAANGDLSAAGKAAKALQEASEALSAGGEKGDGQGSGQQADGPEGPPGQGSGQKAQASGGPAGLTTGGASGKDAPGQNGFGRAQGVAGNALGGSTGGNGQGVPGTQTAANDSRPAAVKEVGIAPSDWAKLPPLMQQQLLNAAQQKGPPAYQEMIKNYYIRIARLQAESE